MKWRKSSKKTSERWKNSEVFFRQQDRHPAGLILPRSVAPCKTVVCQKLCKSIVGAAEGV
jgi:hypothetical protein